MVEVRNFSSPPPAMGMGLLSLLLAAWGGAKTDMGEREG